MSFKYIVEDFNGYNKSTQKDFESYLSPKEVFYNLKEAFACAKRNAEEYLDENVSLTNVWYDDINYDGYGELQLHFESPNNYIVFFVHCSTAPDLEEMEKECRRNGIGKVKKNYFD